MGSLFTRKSTVVAVTLVVIGALIVSAWFAERIQAKPAMSLAEAVHNVQSQYDGEIVAEVKEGDVYRIKLKSDLGLYELAVPVNGHGIASIQRLETYVDVSPDKTTDIETEMRPEREDNTPPVATKSPSPTSSPEPTPAPTPSTSPSKTPPTSPSPAPSKTPSPSKPPTASWTPSPPSKPPSKPSPPALLSSEDAAKLALAKVPGKVKDIDLEKKQSVRYYLVEIVTPNGRSADVQLNAASGKIMSVTWSDDDDEDDEDEDDNEDKGYKGRGKGNDRSRR